MPIVDGLTSTKMIRSYEKEPEHLGYSTRAASNGRIPIFAVSASLVEQDRQIYIDAGFDGWILKPIDFKRLNFLLLGISDEQARQSCLYAPGGWEQGGWFQSKQGRDDYASEDVTPTVNTENKELSVVVVEEATSEVPSSTDADVTPIVRPNAPGK